MGFTILQEKTRNPDKIFLKICFFLIKRTVIPERQETKEVSLTTALAYCLEFPSYSTKREIPGDIQQAL